MVINNLTPKTTDVYDDYTKLKVIGYGASGRVYLCEHKRTRLKYALKILSDSPKARREVDLHWRSCQGCESVVQIIEVYENIVDNYKQIFMIMECIEGGELFDRIKERIKRPFTEKEVAQIMFQICSAVKYLHDSGIAHRDLKPENLLLTSNDQDAIIKLTDFGFAKETSLGLRTPCYSTYFVAPEILGSELYDKSCDLWSLGVIMYILCCGYPPFYSTSGAKLTEGMKIRIRAGEYTFPEEDWANVSIEAKNLIKKLLITNPKERFNIDQVMSNVWISKHVDIPQTELTTTSILQEDLIKIREMNEAISGALFEMRVNYDDNTNLKSIDEAKSNNKLLKKRLNKNN